MQVNKTIHATVRFTRETKDEVDEIADLLGVQKSYLYRWIIEGFVETVKSEEEQPDLPAVTQLARQLLKKKNQKGTK
jgi:transposase-like protein